MARAQLHRGGRATTRVDYGDPQAQRRRRGRIRASRRARRGRREEERAAAPGPQPPAPAEGQKTPATTSVAAVEVLPAKRLSSSGDAAFSAFSVSAAATCAHYGVDAAVGLSTTEAAARLVACGANELGAGAPSAPPAWRAALARTAGDPLARVLLAAAAVSTLLALQEGARDAAALAEPGVILLILVINAIVKAAQEEDAAAALEALKRMQPATARVRRGDTRAVEVATAELVPGDVVELCVGDKVPADCRLVELKTATLQADESSLTGESEPAIKATEAVPRAADLLAKSNMLFASTSVLSGSCVAIVTATGASTELGKIQASVATAAAEDVSTPLKRQPDAFASDLTK